MMDAYIKLSDAIKLLRVDCVQKYPNSFIPGLKAAAKELEKMPHIQIINVDRQKGEE